jgi:hypothetical protein
MQVTTCRNLADRAVEREPMCIVKVLLYKAIDIKGDVP